jgi:SAM-dependent methyltransferase
VALYDETMAPDYAHWRTPHPQLLDSLVAVGAVLAESSVLELGCGTGNYIRALCERTGCVGWGLDPSSAMLAQAQTAISRRLHWVYASAERTGLDDAQFHLAFCVDVVHHLSNRAVAFQEAHRVLHPSGALCVATESEQMIRCRAPLSVYWPETIEVDLARYPRIGTVQSELHKAGFVRLDQLEVESGGLLPDSGPFQAKVFSCLRALPDEVYQQGLAHLEADLLKGAISFTRRYLILWAYKREKGKLLERA